MNKKVDDLLNEYRKLGCWELVYLMFFISSIIFIVLVFIESNKFLYGILLLISLLIFWIYGIAIRKQREKCESFKYLLYFAADVNNKRNHESY